MIDEFAVNRPSTALTRHDQEKQRCHFWALVAGRRVRHGSCSCIVPEEEGEGGGGEGGAMSRWRSRQWSVEARTFLGDLWRGVWGDQVLAGRKSWWVDR